MKPKGFSHPKFINLTGRKFHRWTALSYDVGLGKWNCICDCGSSGAILGSNLRHNYSKSCGCLHAELAAERGKSFGSRMRKHGHTVNGPSPTYQSWLGMKTRCYKPAFKQFKDYGGRGIQVCLRWLESFDNFLEDMGEKPDNLTIDRINNDWSYMPSNCRWATRSQQQYNRRKKHEDANHS